MPTKNAARETLANRNPDALADFLLQLLQAAGRGGNQLAARAVQQQHRGGIGIQDLPDPAQQRGEEVITIRRDLGYVRPEKQTVGISAVPPRQLPAESGVAEIGRLLRITPGAPAE